MKAQQLLEVWYLEQKRDLPWRRNRDAYKIWISETMLQQTTVTAVLPYYERFLERFPTLQDLAAAPLADVLRSWAGLGYYSRARNLHQAAKLLACRKKFPQSYRELLELPGFGPYTARAVSSLAFSEPVGVLDCNVIRVMSRLHALRLEWWRPAIRAQLQESVDQFVAQGPVHILNQALMELGSQICTPQNPKCVMCPLLSECTARKKSLWSELPLKKPRRAREMWQWTVSVETRGDRVRLTENDYAPFLRGSWLLPGIAKKLRSAPKKYDFRHSITHHDIYVTVGDKPTSTARNKSRSCTRWVEIQDLETVAPYSLVKKAWRWYSKASGPNASSGKVSVSFVIALITVIAAGFVFAASGCQSLKKTNSSKTPPIIEHIGPYSLVTQRGVNRTPRLSPGGSRLLYISAHRRSHANPQLYELDLKSKIERRLTFQDGEIFDGVFDRTGKRIFYSSSTDEIKENPTYLLKVIDQFKYGGSGAKSAPVLKPSKPKNFWGEILPPTDLYEALADGSQIRRLTKTDSFDGEIDESPTSNTLAFVALSQQRLVLYQMILRHQVMKRLSPIPTAIERTDSADEWPRYSPNGKKLVWVHETGAKKSELWISNADGSNARMLVGGDAVYWTPSWTPDNNEILFSSNRLHHKQYELYVVKTDGTCLKKLTKNSALHTPMRIWHAELDPNENEIFFTSDVSGVTEIYKWKLTDAQRAILKNPCPPPVAAKPTVATPSAASVPSKSK